MVHLHTWHTTTTKKKTNKSTADKSIFNCLLVIKLCQFAYRFSKYKLCVCIENWKVNTQFMQHGDNQRNFRRKNVSLSKSFQSYKHIYKYSFFGPLNVSIQKWQCDRKFTTTKKNIYLFMFIYIYSAKERKRIIANRCILRILLISEYFQYIHFDLIFT